MDFIAAGEAPRLLTGMNISEEELQFLRELVKGSRQRVHHLSWVDRDGTPRSTALNDAELKRIKGMASVLGIAPAEVLRQAAHVPNAR